MFRKFLPYNFTAALLKKAGEMGKDRFGFLKLLQMAFNKLFGKTTYTIIARTFY